MTEKTMPITGGCLCGAVRFESNAPPKEGYYCHCTLCQKAYGGLFSATLRVSGSGFRYTKGDPKIYCSTNFAKRSFCPECGTPLPFVYEGGADVWIKIGTLDHPADWPMTSDALWGNSQHIHVDSRIPWEKITDGLLQSMSAPDVQKVAEKYVEKVEGSDP